MFHSQLRMFLRVSLLLITCLASFWSWQKNYALPLMPPSPLTTVLGAFHIHSQHSHDSQLSYKALVQTAKQLQLDFLIITDHNSQEDLSQIVNNDLHDPLLFSYAELSTPFGHVIQFGKEQLLDNNIRRSQRLHQSIAQDGGFSIIAHPSDLKQPWRGPLTQAGGIEIANWSASSRALAQPFGLGLLPAMLMWLWSPDRALAKLYEKDTIALSIWDHNLAQGVGFCGSDTHGYIPIKDNLRAWYMVLQNISTPSFSNQQQKRLAITKALRAGTFYCQGGLFGHGSQFRFGVIDKEKQFKDGMSLTFSKSSVQSLFVQGPSTLGHGEQLVLYRNGIEIARKAHITLRYDDPPTGRYRVEVHWPLANTFGKKQAVPFIYSNAIWIKAS